MLIGLGHDVETVPDEGLGGATDTQVWHAAQEESRFFITQDLDFSDIDKFSPGSHHGVLLVRLHNPSRHALIDKIESLFRAEMVDDWQRCFVVATDRKLRVRRP